MTTAALLKRVPVSSLPFNFQRASAPSWWLTRAFAGTSSPRLTEQDFTQAREWHASITNSALLRDIGEVTYSRSSGPGGQNVNKVNSKAQLRVPVDDLFPRIPSILHHGVKTSRYYTEKTRSLLIQADDSRKQQENKDSCYRKLTQVIMDVYRSTVPGETSQEQKDKVKELKKTENESRLKSKKVQSSKKASRAGSFRD